MPKCCKFNFFLNNFLVYLRIMQDTRDYAYEDVYPGRDSLLDIFCRVYSGVIMTEFFKDCKRTLIPQKVGRRQCVEWSVENRATNSRMN